MQRDRPEGRRLGEILVSIGAVTPKELERLYVRYARGQGQLYGKHLGRGDLGIARFVLRDFLYVCRAALAAVRNRSLHPDPWALGIVRGMPRGLAEGWRSTRS